MRPIRIVTTNPQPLPEKVPGLTTKVRLTNTGKNVAVFQTMSTERRIPITSGEVLIVDEGRPGASDASNLTLAPPQHRNGSEAGSDGAVLRIISACPLKHIVRTPPEILNGRASTLTFNGTGTAVELYAHGGLWLVLSSAGVTIK